LALLSEAENLLNPKGRRRAFSKNEAENSQKIKSVTENRRKPQNA
jgi:hypothetical protein